MFWLGLGCGVLIYIVVVAVMSVVGIIKEKKKKEVHDDVRD